MSVSWETILAVYIQNTVLCVTIQCSFSDGCRRFWGMCFFFLEGKNEKVCVLC